MGAPAELLAALRQAVQAEIQGQHFYLMAARSTEDPKGREVFERLAAEEALHQDFLRRQHQSLQATGRADPSLRLSPPDPPAGPDPIFSPALHERVGQAHFEMTALAVGIQLEQNAERFYREQAKSSRDEALRAFFERLATWEAGHYRALLTQQDALQKDYWSAGGFAPF
ncbi:MAG: ferritin family protein [Myxococcales bacterium]|nr:ferritin family protein [Myxococcales bacterium]